MRRPVVPIYAITLVLSAFLLFSVQPMLAKMILPLLGGAPAVWNVAMVFFQAALLAGYIYAHATSRFLSLRVQAVLHIILLAAFAAFLPFSLQAGLVPSSHPALWELGVLATIAGAPFFIVSASAPLLQRWFSASGHTDSNNPYFLYAASNIGSLAALLAYPVLVEPFLKLGQQTAFWAAGYGALVAMVALCALAVWHRKLPPAPQMKAHAPRLTRLAWLGLAFIPSSLMLGVTTYITTDIAAVPLLWVIPLALYLLTFILVFARRQIVRMDIAVSLFTAFLILTLGLETARILDKTMTMICMHLALFFFAALLCHKKLADLRPPAAGLTGYYMIMALGGVAGGLFNALLAPVLFVVPVEYALVMCVVVFVRGYCFMPGRMVWAWPPRQAWPQMAVAGLLVLAVFLCWALRAPPLIIGTALLTVAGLLLLRARPMGFALLASFLLLAQIGTTTLRNTHILELRRNFFGVLQVNDAFGERNFMDGTTLHGAQPLDAAYRLVPMTYYSPAGPLGDVFRLLDKREGKQKIAVIGLGVGSVDCYGRAGRQYDFYEINPAVVQIAQDKALFTYLSGCASPYTITLGDGRLMIGQVPDGTYDALILDAFSSDNIPMHLLTLNAFRLYMRKVKKNGMIIINISNKFLDLEPQIAALSRATRVPAVLRFGHGGPVARGSNLDYASSLWVVFSYNPKTIIPLRLKDRWRAADQANPHPVWTDDYANIITSLIAFIPLRRWLGR